MLSLIHIFFFKKRNDQEYLFAKTLDHISDGIQIYDKNACAVFFNKASREIAHIPSDVSLSLIHILKYSISCSSYCLRQDLLLISAKPCRSASANG